MLHIDAMIRVDAIATMKIWCLSEDGNDVSF